MAPKSWPRQNAFAKAAGRRWRGSSPAVGTGGLNGSGGQQVLLLRLSAGEVKAEGKFYEFDANIYSMNRSNVEGI